MNRDALAQQQTTYPVRATARLTGLSPEVLRAWERRYGAVEPIRTSGGTRRYRAEDVARLRLLKRAVDAGGRIGDLAGLSSEALEQMARDERAVHLPVLDDLMNSVATLDAVRTQNLLSQQFAAVGAARFAADVACPLLHEIGARWEQGEIDVASEHLATSTLRSMLGPVLQHTRPASGAPVVLFATPPGERHELGLLVAAITAASSGVNVTYLGPDLPVDQIVSATKRSRAEVLALSVICLDPGEARTAIASLREQLSPQVGIWIGGAGSASMALAGVDHLANLDALEGRIALLLASEIRS